MHQLSQALLQRLDNVKSQVSRCRCGVCRVQDIIGPSILMQHCFTKRGGMPNDRFIISEPSGIFYVAVLSLQPRVQAFNQPRRMEPTFRRERHAWDCKWTNDRSLQPHIHQRAAICEILTLDPGRLLAGLDMTMLLSFHTSGVTCHNTG